MSQDTRIFSNLIHYRQSNYMEEGERKREKLESKTIEKFNGSLFFLEPERKLFEILYPFQV